MEQRLKHNAISAMIWTAFGKFGMLSIQLAANMCLARLLMPADFGAVGMLTIFMAVSEVFITAGFGQALIQKKKIAPIDCTTVFYWNLFASGIIYLVLFFCAPMIAAFYNMPILSSVLRVQSLSLIISSFSIVQNNLLQKNLQFKALYVRTLIATVLGTSSAIILAIKGYGIWSLVFSSLVSSFANSLLLWFRSSWKPTLAFSVQSFRELFSFGSLMAMSSIVDQLYQEIQGLIIGKMYSATDMGYYAQARKLNSVPTSSLSQIVSQVSFPVFSKLQNDKDNLRNAVRKTAKSVTYLNFPLMMLLVVIAPPLIHLLYGDKWDASIPYFRILCVSGMFYTILTTNNSVVKSLGKSALFLKIRLIQRGLGIAFMCFGAVYSIKGILYGLVIGNCFNYLIVSWYTSKLIDYSLWNQMKDIGNSFATSIIAALIACFAGEYAKCNQYLIMFLQVLIYVVCYIGTTALLKNDAFYIYRNIILKKIGKNDG